MKIEDFRLLAEQGALINEEHKRIEFSLPNGGRVVGYFPLESVQVYAYDIHGGVLPRKTFSMGHAEEKRYYLEARKIRE